MSVEDAKLSEDECDLFVEDSSLSVMDWGLSVEDIYLSVEMCDPGHRESDMSVEDPELSSETKTLFDIMAFILSQ